MPDDNGPQQCEWVESTLRHALRHSHLAERALLRGDYRGTVVAVVSVAGALDDLAQILDVAPEVVL